MGKIGAEAYSDGASQCNILQQACKLQHTCTVEAFGRDVPGSMMTQVWSTDSAQIAEHAICIDR